MSFRTRRIRQKPRLHILRKFKKGANWLQNHFASLGSKQRSYAVGGFLVLVAGVIVWKAMLGVYGWVTNFEPEDLLFAAATELQQDENGYTNLVLLGDGGHVRDGADLIDTIMVASIDHQKNAVSLFSIPRDYYVHGVGARNNKINELYRNNKKKVGEKQAFELFRDAAGVITDLDIHYYLRTDFNAFVEVIDTLGGIDINVPETIEDPYYPNETDDGVITFEIKKGPQNLDGETALKYVRSRKTTSDFDRAARQQLVLAAIREKALSKDLLTDTKTLKKLYENVKQNLNTNLSWREMLALGRFAKEFDRSHLVTKVIHDDPGQEGGFLYTPERKFYDGQFVLVPFGDNLDLIHRYMDLIFHKREAFFTPKKIEILNATKTPGIARKTAYQLNRFGFNVTTIDNLLDAAGERTYLEKGLIRYYDWQEDEEGNVIPKHHSFLEALQGFVNTEALPADPISNKSGVDMTVILGDDYQPIVN